MRDIYKRKVSPTSLIFVAIFIEYFEEYLWNIYLFNDKPLIHFGNLFHKGISVKCKK